MGTPALECPDCGKFTTDFANPEQLSDCVSLWQRRLFLRDWEIGVRLARHHELNASEWSGQINYNTERREALIDLLDPADARPNKTFPHDVERTLVHELLHIHLAPMGAQVGTPEQVAEEQAICALSRALVELARQIPEAEEKTAA